VKLGVVVPRYGPVVGGAEHLMRRLAEELVSRSGWEVEVFTTTAHSAATWDPAEPEGTTALNGVTVHRFDPTSGRDPRWAEVLPMAEAVPRGLHDRMQAEYYAYQGPRCPDVIDAAEDSDCQLVAFAPYLFWPTVEGVRRLGRRAVLHSCAHDETPLHIPLMREVFAAAGGLCFLSRAEAGLVLANFGVAGTPRTVLGGGLEPPPTDQASLDVAGARASSGIGDRQYVVCLGRVENGKGARLLDLCFRRYKERRPGPLAMAFVGPALERLDPHPDIVITGAVADDRKWALLRGAEVLITPSAMESFSFVVLEGWQAGLPALVNALCGPTTEHCREGHGGLWFADYPSFEAALDRLMDNAGLRRRLARSGRHYAEQHFDWTRIVAGYEHLCAAVARHSRSLPSAP
jgi:glycosyltransferase involved in cell wall biosynthesis